MHKETVASAAVFGVPVVVYVALATPRAPLSRRRGPPRRPVAVVLASKGLDEHPKLAPLSSSSMRTATAAGRDRDASGLAAVSVRARCEREAPVKDDGTSYGPQPRRRSRASRQKRLCSAASSSFSAVYNMRQSGQHVAIVGSARPRSKVVCVRCCGGRLRRRRGRLAPDAGAAMSSEADGAAGGGQRGKDRSALRLPSAPKRSSPRSMSVPSSSSSLQQQQLNALVLGGCVVLAGGSTHWGRERASLLLLIVAAVDDEGRSGALQRTPLAVCESKVLGLDDAVAFRVGVADANTFNRVG